MVEGVTLDGEGVGGCNEMAVWGDIRWLEG